MNLYGSLAKVYHELYQDLFDYDEEFSLYHSVLQQFSSKKIIEFGCGTGNLATRFVQAGYQYKGVDLSEEMLKIAAEYLPESYFEKGNIINFESQELVDAALLTGRTITYFTSQTDILASFNSVNNTLKEGGIFVFDAIDAFPFFQEFDTKPSVVVAGKYKRESISTPMLSHGWMWHWVADYYGKNGETYDFLGRDEADLRAFMREELALLLCISGFELLECAPKDVYAWKTSYFVARKTGEKTY